MRTAGDILTRARRTLSDPDAVTWSDEDLWDGLTMALSSLCAVKNDAYRVVRDIPLVAGYVQSLPAAPLTGDVPAGLAVFEVFANTNGEAVNQVGRELLNAANPDWVRNTPQTSVTEWMADVRNRSMFLVNPPNDGTGSVKVLYGAIPPEITGNDDVIPVSDTYEVALWSFVVSYAYGMNTKRRDPTKEAFYMQQFERQIGLRTASQVQTAPQLASTEPQ